MINKQRRVEEGKHTLEGKQAKRKQKMRPLTGQRYGTKSPEKGQECFLVSGKLVD